MVAVHNDGQEEDWSHGTTYIQQKFLKDKHLPKSISMHLYWISNPQQKIARNETTNKSEFYLSES